MAATSAPTKGARRPSTPPSQHDTSVPSLITPAPPSNTLLLTNLTNPLIFEPSSLSTIRTHIESILPGGASDLHAFSPLRSFKRIVLAFSSAEPAIQLRRELDGVELMGCDARLYFGAPTPIDTQPQLLQAPVADKQFFISPPPSPPHGWTMRHEDPPNKEVHAADLVSALAKLQARRGADAHVMDFDSTEAVPATTLSGHGRNAAQGGEDTEMRDVQDEYAASLSAMAQSLPRRKSSTVVYQPEAHGGSPGLPAVMVEDVSEDGEPQIENDKRILEHTARPPVELME